MNIDEILSTETNKGTTNSVSREELLAIAMKAISFGWSLIPVAKDKKPILNWKEFQFRRAPEEEVRGWFEKYPEVQLGVVTGEISNLTVVDMEEGADFSLIKDKTFKIKTGGNGIHWYFQYESDFKNAVRLLPLTDVRSEGGYCVTLGSTTSKGSYLALDDCPVAKMSQATKDLLLTGKRVASSSSINPKEMRELADIFLKVEVANYTGAGSGGRNDTMARFIGKLLNTVHPLKWDSDALPAILQANQKNTPPLPQNEVMATYESIKRSDVSNKLIKPQGSAPVAVQEEIDPEDEAIVLMSEAADKQKVDLSKFFPLGIEIFDKEIKGGVHYGDLITIAGMPGEGKSSWCMNLAKNFIGGGEKVLFFSYEMLVQMVWEKFALMGVKPSDQIYCPFKTVTGDVGWVENRIIEAKEKLGIKIIMIDHFSFLSGRKVLSKMSETESSALTKIVKDIKEIAKQQEVIIFMPVHVRKQGQNYKKNEELTMDSIAHTAGVAQLSDLVFTIQREKHQDPAASDIYTGFTSISMVKNRWGHKNPRGYFEMINEQFIYNKEYNGINRPANVVHPAVAAEEVSPFPVQEVTKEEFTKDMEEDAVNSLFKGLIIKGQNQ